MIYLETVSFVLEWIFHMVDKENLRVRLHVTKLYHFGLCNDWCEVKMFDYGVSLDVIYLDFSANELGLIFLKGFL